MSRRCGKDTWENFEIRNTYANTVYRTTDLMKLQFSVNNIDDSTRPTEDLYLPNRNAKSKCLFSIGSFKHILREIIYRLTQSKGK